MRFSSGVMKKSLTKRLLSRSSHYRDGLFDNRRQWHEILTSQINKILTLRILLQTVSFIIILISIYPFPWYSLHSCHINCVSIFFRYEDTSVFCFAILTHCFLYHVLALVLMFSLLRRAQNYTMHHCSVLVIALTIFVQISYSYDMIYYKETIVLSRSVFLKRYDASSKL